MRFKVSTGTHVDVNGVIHTAGTDSEVVESEKRLDLKWKNKFTIINIDDSSPAASATAPVVTDVVSEKTKPETTSGESVVPTEETKTADAKPRGLDVTALFVEAFGKQFKVHKNGGLFDVVKDGVAVNPDPLTKELVRMYLKENG